MGSEVVLADRVRDNLIMDSGVAAVCMDAFGVRIVMRAQASDHPSSSEAELFDFARALGKAACEARYEETRTAVIPVPDPADGERTLDTWYEVTYEKSGLDLARLVLELRQALQFRKIA
jgi:hypothetical protein